jgi:uncharacterized protein with gpF-like domain
VDSETIIWKRLDMMREGYVRKYYNLFRRVFNQLYQGLADRVSSDNAMSAAQLVSQIDRTEIEKAMMSLYTSVGGKFAEDTYSQYAKSTPENWQAWFVGYVKNSLDERLKSITGETRAQALRLINQAIEDGVSRGEGVDVIARNIKKSLIKDSIPINTYRAARIARTEVVNASNVGSLKGARDLQLPMRKTWITTRDGRARDTHGIMDGQTVLLDEQFMVGGYKMDGPGDPAGGPEETINCRCGLTYRVVR